MLHSRHIRDWIYIAISKISVVIIQLGLMNYLLRCFGYSDYEFGLAMILAAGYMFVDKLSKKYGGMEKILCSKECALSSGLIATIIIIIYLNPNPPWLYRLLDRQSSTKP